MDPAQPQYARTPVLALASAALLSLGATVAIVLVAHGDRVAGARLGMLLAGVAALAGGLSVLAVSHGRARRGSGTERPRMLLGAALTVWGAGQVLLSMQLTPTGQRTFGVGDLVSTLCMPILVLALVSMPRHSRMSGPALRLALDSVIVTGAVTLGLWWILLQPAAAAGSGPGCCTASVVSCVVMASFDVGAAAMSALAWARDRRRGLGAVALGLALQAVADITSMPAVLAGRPMPWISGAVWCLGIPLVAVGIIGYLPALSGDRAEILVEDIGEARATVASTVVALAVLAVAAGAPVADRWSPIGVVLAGLTVLLLVVRELVNGLLRHRMVRWLATEALRDVLTGLPNRSALTARLRTLDRSGPWTLLTVDIDGFKGINDLLGAEAGDALLVRVGAALRRASPSRCLVARLDGDAFGVIAPGDVEAGERLAQRLCDAVRDGVGEHGGAAVTVSVGVGRAGEEPCPAVAATVTRSMANASAMAAGQTRDGESLAGGGAAPAGDGAPRGDDVPRGDRLHALVEADAALRAAKAAGRGRVTRYPGAVEEARRRRLLLERRLRSAVATGGIEMHAQPLVDLRTGQILGFESLARWTDVVLGPVQPGEFVPVAEQTGLITALGSHALRSTLREASRGGLAGLEIEIGVNVSPIQLRNRDFAPLVVDLVAESGLDPGQLVLEVTEAVLVAEDDPAAGALDRLATAGIHLAIDDFGTGYSALGYLRRLPIDVLKIDRSWVVASVTEARTRAVVAGVVSLAHTLGATVVMEGIEDEATVQVCRDLEADIGQGWLFGRPGPWPAAAAAALAEATPLEATPLPARNDAPTAAPDERPPDEQVPGSAAGQPTGWLSSSSHAVKIASVNPSG